MTAVQNLQRLGIVVPEPPAAVGAYVTWVRTGNLILTSGQLRWRNKTMLHPGRLGGEVSVEDGYQAARQAGLNAIHNSNQPPEAILTFRRRTTILHSEGGDYKRFF